MFLHLSVSHSVHGGCACSRGVPAPGGCLLWGGLPAPGGVPASGEGACSGGGCLLWGMPAPGEVPGGDPPGRLLLRAVRILLECILV